MVLSRKQSILVLALLSFAPGCDSLTTSMAGKIITVHKTLAKFHFKSPELSLRLKVSGSQIFLCLSPFGERKKSHLPTQPHPS